MTESFKPLNVEEENKLLTYDGITVSTACGNGRVSRDIRTRPLQQAVLTRSRLQSMSSGLM